MACLWNFLKRRGDSLNSFLERDGIQIDRIDEQMDINIKAGIGYMNVYLPSA
jgi:hypothetical protein